jgi:transposase
MHFIQAENRNQYVLMNKLDDLVQDNHYVRLIDIFVDYFMQKNQGSFSLKGAQLVGRRAYAPASLLKLYIYSYLNSISSSRKIEKECKRNIELIWLMGNLVPDHKTIADFRRENANDINKVFLELVKLLKESGYIKGTTISIDGSKIRANASIKIDIDTISKKLENIEEQLSKYLGRVDVVDSIDEEIEQAEQEKALLQEQIRILQEEKQALEMKKHAMEEQGIRLMSPTDPESRMMRGRQGLKFCYNFQAAIDANHQMIANVDMLTNENDKGQLLHMVEKIEDELGVKPDEVLADAGYYVINQIKTLEVEKNIDCYVAINYNQQENKKRNFGIDFIYMPQENIYRCSQNQTLEPQYGSKKDSRRGTLAQAYVGVNCSKCPVKDNCTKSKARTVYRFADQEWRDNYETKMKSDLGKAKLIQRMSLSEHPFGTIKSWMGYISLKVRGKEKVKAEINLYAIAYNLKRLTNIEGFDTFLKILKEKRKVA